MGNGTYSKRIRGTREERFWPKVRKRGAHECWEWLACRNRSGYGQMKKDHPSRRAEGAHRASWEIHNGPIPEGLCVLHRCDNPPCVNPDHLFLGTPADNARDRGEKGRTRTGVTYGADHYRAKMTPRLVVKLISDYRQGRGDQRELAAKYGISQTQVSRIIQGRSWRRALAEIGAPFFDR